ncbi:ProB Glutamate 5-kinase [Methylophilaceae bacterium]|jgi:glutamate 5-kinase
MNSVEFKSLVLDAKVIVVKVGSSLVTNDGNGLDQLAIAAWAEQIAALVRQGKQVVLVSSGAVAEGMQRLGWKKRPTAVNELQAAAAVGQMGLVQMYESCFSQHKLHTAQVLLTHDDLADRKRYLNARSTLRTLLDLKVIPIINENDTVVTDEIRFGDNDTLGSLVANLIEADVLVILTDQQGLYSADPRQDKNAKFIQHAIAGDVSLERMAGGAGTNVGTGGMLTKILAAKRASRSGAHTVIASGREKNVLVRLAVGEVIGTHLQTTEMKTTARKQWLADHLQLRGKLTLDAGAVKVIKQEGKSLLPIGVIAIEGTFERGEVVACCDANGDEIARGLVNYSSTEALRIMRKPSAEIEKILGYVEESELIHRDNLVLL